MAQKSAPTIYDIAKLAGVNPSTVSRALSTPGRINSKTEEKVKKAAQELNYRVNPFARALPTGRTKMIALVVADITNPVFFNAIRGAESVASAAGYTLVVAESQESSANEARVTQQILPSVDGLVMVTSRLSDKEIQELNKIKPVSLMNRVVKGVNDVVPRVEPGIKEAISHLHSLGHEHIAYVSGPSNSWMSIERWRLLMKNALKVGMSIVEIGSTSPTLEGGKDAFDRVKAAGVTAVIAYNDLVAIGLMREAQANGLKIPSQLSIIGFDNIFGSDFTSPGLTTIATQLNQVGAEAVTAILNALQVDGQEFDELGNHETSLIIRQSTGKAGIR
jgi:LacI family transcriptional regulator